nr:MAG TPA: hypothetical protein [Caudoviricetes sp.]
MPILNPKNPKNTLFSYSYSSSIFLFLPHPAWHV